VIYWTDLDGFETFAQPAKNCHFETGTEKSKHLCNGEVVVLNAAAAISMTSNPFLSPHKIKQSGFEGHLRKPVKKKERKER